MTVDRLREKAAPRVVGRVAMTADSPTRATAATAGASPRRQAPDRAVTGALTGSAVGSAAQREELAARTVRPSVPCDEPVGVSPPRSCEAATAASTATAPTPPRRARRRVRAFSGGGGTVIGGA